MGWRRHSGRVTLESSHKWAENCLMCEELAPTQMWLYLHRNWTPFLSLLYGFGRCFWCFHTILRPPEQNQKKHQTSVQLFHYTLVKSHKYTNSAEGNGNDIKTDTGYYMKIHHHRHHYILIQQKWQIKTRQWQMVSKNGPWIHPGKRCIKATCISAFLVFKQNKNCFSRQRDERQRCRAAGGRSGGFDGGFRSFTHSLCCIWKEGQLVMRKCKDLLKRYVYIIVFCVFCYIWFHIFYFSVFIHLFWKLHCRILSLHLK